MNILLTFFVSSAVKTKKPIQTKFRMPLLNWQALKPNQVTGTVFNDLDDEKVLDVRTCSLSFSFHSPPTQFIRKLQCGNPPFLTLSLTRS